MTVFPNIEGVSWHGAHAGAKRTDFLINNLVPMKGVGLLVGAPGVGKTFLTIAMAVSIASGQRFAGRWFPASSNESGKVPSIRTGATLILAGEGIETYEQRFDAAYQGLSPTARRHLLEVGSVKALPIGLMPAYGLREDGIFRACLKKVREISDHLKLGLSGADMELRLIVVDTLPAVFGFRDENSAAEAQGVMNKLVRLSQETDAFVLATGHPKKGKNRGYGARGSGVFDGAADIILEASESGKAKTRNLTLRKSRYRESNRDTWPFRLVGVDLGSGNSSAYIDGSHVLPAPGFERAEGKPSGDGMRLPQAASWVADAMRRSMQRESIPFVTSAGEPVDAVYEEAVRNELSALVPLPTTTYDPTEATRCKDRLRHTHKRGIERLLECGLIGRQFVEDTSHGPLLWFVEG